MNRRTLLRKLGGATLIGSTAGCLSQAASRTLSSKSTETMIPADALLKVAINQCDSTPENVPVMLNATVTESVVSPDHTARLRISLTNEADAKRTFAFGFSPPFSVLRSVTDNPSILLLDPHILREDDGTYRRVAPDCWRPALKPGTAIVPPDVRREVTLAPGEQVAREALLWGDYKNEDDLCLPSGSFRFEHSYEFDDVEQFIWGFSLTLTVPPEQDQ